MVKALPTAPSIAAVGRIAGYGIKEAVLRGYKRIKERAPEMLERIGFGEEHVLGKLGKLIEAKETKFFHHQGIVMETREVEALGIQIKAVDMALQVQGAKVSGNGSDFAGHQAGGITIRLEISDPSRVEEIHRALSGRSATGGSASEKLLDLRGRPEDRHGTRRGP